MRETTQIPVPDPECEPWIAAMIDGLLSTAAQKATETPTAGYDLAGAAKFLGMSQRKLREMVKDRRIACTRIDYRNFLFTLADLDEFLAAYRTKPRRI